MTWNSTDVKELIAEGEGTTIEFKRKLDNPEKIARSISAFANTEGGVILFGIDDNGSVIGVESEKSVTEEILLAGAEFCDPPIEPEIESVSVRGKEVIVVTVPVSTEKPVYVSDGSDTDNGNSKVYVRVNDKTMLASRETAGILYAENPESPPLRISIGEYEHKLFELLESRKEITVEEYARAIGISYRKASRILIRLTRAGVLQHRITDQADVYSLA